MEIVSFPVGELWKTVQGKKVIKVFDVLIYMTL